MVLLGDLNAAPDTPEVAALVDQLTDAWVAAGVGDGNTFSSQTPTSRIDYVLTSRDVTARTAAVIASDASDHRPVVASLSAARLQTSRHRVTVPAPGVPDPDRNADSVRPERPMRRTVGVGMRRRKRRLGGTAMGHIGTRRMRTTMVAALAVGLLVAVMPGAGAQDDGPRQLAFGAFARPKSGQTLQDAVLELEAKTGRRMEVVRVFQLWQDSFPNSFHNFNKAGDRTMILSVKPQRPDGTRISWSSIATAAPGSQLDTEMRSWARRLRDFGAPMYVTFHHEPEASANTPHGSATNYIAAWRRWTQVMAEEGATNVRHMWITTDYAQWLPSSDRRYAPKWYPGDAYVDAMAIDVYNWAECRPSQDNPWKSVQQILDPFRDFGRLHPDKPLWLTEWATAEDPTRPGRKATWFDDARALFTKPGYEQFQGVSYFHSTNINPLFTGCQWWADSSASSLASFSAMANDPTYAGDAFGSTGTTTTTTTDHHDDVPPGGRDALLVVGNPTLSAGDTAARNRLTAAGYAVRVLDDSQAVASVPEDIVVISSSVSSGTVRGTYRTVPRPVLVYKPWIYGDMGLAPAGGFSSASGTTVTISAPADPLAAGLSGTVALTSTAGPIGRATPGPAAAVVATAGGQAALFAYDPGDVLADGSAAASCRIALPFADTTFAQLTNQGAALFDAAVQRAGAC